MLREEGNSVSCFFFNPNVHPYTEHQRRLESARKFCDLAGVGLVGEPAYELEPFLRSLVHHEEARCPICYRYRLERVASFARESGFDAFSTTLLVSPHQEQDVIKEIGRDISEEFGINFYDRDFRPVWKRGREIAGEMELYRQQYCGCIYSEKERYLR